MPELPEVETVARGLNQRIAGDVIESVWLGSKTEPLKSPPRENVKILEGKKIAGVRRVGKHVVVDLATRRKKQPTAQWIVHLGMTGRLLVCAPGTEKAKHTHAIATLASGRELRFIDPRRFGRLSVAQQFQAPGTEPLEV